MGHWSPSGRIPRPKENCKKGDWIEKESMDAGSDAGAVDTVGLQE